MHDVGKSAVRNIRRAAYTGIRQCDLASRMEQLDVREGSILLKKSKIERLLKSCESRCLDVFAAAMLARAIVGSVVVFVKGVVVPRNASAVLKHFVRQSERTFSTVSAKSGRSREVRPDIA